MIKAGLTGNIGSGKSTVARVFEILGIKIFYADEEGRKLYFQEAVKDEITSLFGKELLTHGQVDRKKLANIVFSDRKALDDLNSIIHPRVRRQYLDWLEKHKEQTYTLHEAAIMFESGFHKMLDVIVFVSAPEELRIQRIIKRDNTNIKSVKERMRNQWPEDQKIRKSDFIIYNDDENMIIPQIIRTDKSIRATLVKAP